MNFRPISLRVTTLKCNKKTDETVKNNLKKVCFKPFLTCLICFISTILCTNGLISADVLLSNKQTNQYMVGVRIYDRAAYYISAVHNMQRPTTLCSKLQQYWINLRWSTIYVVPINHKKTALFFALSSQDVVNPSRCNVSNAPYSDCQLMYHNTFLVIDYHLFLITPWLDLTWHNKLRVRARNAKRRLLLGNCNVTKSDAV